MAVRSGIDEQRVIAAAAEHRAMRVDPRFARHSVQTVPRAAGAASAS